MTVRWWDSINLIGYNLLRYNKWISLLYNGLNVYITLIEYLRKQSLKSILTWSICQRDFLLINKLQHNKSAFNLEKCWKWPWSSFSLLCCSLFINKIYFEFDPILGLYWLLWLTDTVFCYNQWLDKAHKASFIVDVVPFWTVLLTHNYLLDATNINNKTIIDETYEFMV